MTEAHLEKIWADEFSGKTAMLKLAAAGAFVDRLVPRLWPDSTIVCLASGPSMMQADADYVCGKAPVIAINDAIRLAPWADVFYSGAKEFWFPEAVAARRSAGFRGLSIRLAWNEGTGRNQMRRGVQPDGVIVLGNTGQDGLETDPNALRTYRNSGGAAINLAVHLGARRIVLLGYDMQPDAHGRHHFHGPPKERHYSPYADFRGYLRTAVAPLARLGVEVVNCSRSTALVCFPRQPLESVL